MLRSSPNSESAASPTGLISSQSSSTSSCYASSNSTASSTRQHPSHPSSSSTSPATVYESGTHPSILSPRTKSSGLTHQPDPQSSQAALFPNSLRPASFSAFGPPMDTNEGTSYSGSFRGPASSSPRGNATFAGVMNQSGSDLGWNHPPPSNAHAYHHPIGATSTSESHSYGTSPESTRGPAAKARRTSPGGSRASGDLHATDHSMQHLSPNSAGGSRRGSLNQVAESRRSTSPHSHSSRPPITSTHNAQASERRASEKSVGFSKHSSPSDAQKGIYSGWTGQNDNAQPFRSGQPPYQGTPSQPGYLSPRSKDNTNSLAPSPSTFGTGPSIASSSPGASSNSLRNKSDSSIRSKQPALPKMNLATFPPQELLKVLATLLHEIATANDEFQPDNDKEDSSRGKRSARSRDRSAAGTPAANAEGSSDATASRNYTAPPGSHLSFNDSRRPSVTTAALGALATPSSTLCFHARNVPSISIESYLLRILKYCPTTNEVFLSLLVYFDRMSRMGTGAKPGANGGGEVAGEAAGLPRAAQRAAGQLDGTLDPNTRGLESAGGLPGSTDTPGDQSYTHPGIRGFAIDSYNVHRLVIAGVTVASKFFSDVFYTNSRYAKVGGLPPHELNQLELQFLLLNDFRLTIPLEEMQRYADQLLMYGSGRPENAKLVKEVSSAPGSALSASSSSVVAQPSSAPNVEMVRKGSKDAASASSSAHAASAASEVGRDEQGDVRMQDA